jgi:hypothetical protein
VPPGGAPPPRAGTALIDVPTYKFRSQGLRISRVETGTLVYYVIEDATRGVQHRLYELEYEVAQLLDGKRTCEKVARSLTKRKQGLQLLAIDVDRFAQQLVALGFAEATDRS